MGCIRHIRRNAAMWCYLSHAWKCRNGSKIVSLRETPSSASTRNEALNPVVSQRSGRSRKCKNDHIHSVVWSVVGMEIYWSRVILKTLRSVASGGDRGGVVLGQFVITSLETPSEDILLSWKTFDLFINILTEQLVDPQLHDTKRECCAASLCCLESLKPRANGQQQIVVKCGA